MIRAPIPETQMGTSWKQTRLWTRRGRGLGIHVEHMVPTEPVLVGE